MNEQIRFFEELSLNSHPSLQTQYYDGWILRFSDGYTGRANSVNLLYPSTLDLHVKVEECEKRYAKQQLPCIFKVTDGSDADLDALLADRGYQFAAPTDLMVMDLTARRFAAGDCIMTEHVTGEWLDTFFALKKITDPVTRAAAAQILGMIRNDTLYCRIEREGRSAACASAVIERGYAAIANVIVEERYRGRGLGRRLCESLLAEAIKKGAHTAYLQVVQRNRIAVNLYESLGYRKLYSYWYRKK